MTKAELINRVHKTKGLPQNVTKKAVAQIVHAVFDELSGYFVRARVSRRIQPRFTYPGFGTFTKKIREERKARNPQTRELIEIPASTTLTFAPGQDLRGQLNRR
jgi:nucleoid DNA-binding protein